MVAHIPSKRFVKLQPGDTDDDLDKLIRAYFLQSLEPDSLIFHVGPYATVEAVRKGDQRQYVRRDGGQNVFDIKSSGRLTLFPNEFALVGSNEYIELSANFGASLSSNVRNTDIGLSHVSTIIDPSWHGKLQIGISNPTRFSKELLYLDALVVVRFHKHSEAAPRSIVERFRSRRPHFGDDWWTIESEPGRRFFQLRKEYSPSGEFTKRIESENRATRLYSYGKRAAQTLGVLSLVSMIFFVAKLYNRIEDASDYRERIVKLEQKQTTLDEISKTFHVIQSGIQVVDFANADSLQFVIPFDAELAVPPFVIVTLAGIQSNEFATTVQLQPTFGTAQRFNAAIVKIVALDKAIARSRTTATWFVARPKGR